MSKKQNNFFKTKNEWSKIKDELLQSYLTVYFQKLLTSRRPTLYIDCFAGKGKFDDGNYGSPLIAIDCINQSVQKTHEFQMNDSIYPYFIEMKYHKELENNLKALPLTFNKPVTVPGTFKEKVFDLLQNKKDWNVFLYIDPFGIKALDSCIFYDYGQFGFHSFEMLINFNSFGFFRDACRAMKVDTSNDEAFQGLDDLVEYDPTPINTSQQSIDLLSKIAGGDYWQDIVLDYQQKKFDGYQAEKHLSNGYKQCLLKKYKYVLDIPIRLKPKHRPKYRMVHVSNHEDGCFLMAENMQKRKDKLFTNIQQAGQISIFDISSTYSSNAEGEIIGEKEIEKMVRDLIQKNDNIRITIFLAKFCTQYGIVCDFSQIYKILDNLKDHKEIEIIRYPSNTSTGKISAFWSEKKGRTVTIRKLQ